MPNGGRRTSAPFIETQRQGKHACESAAWHGRGRGPSAMLCAAKTGCRPGMRAFLREFQRRNVFRVGAAYVAVAWLLIQLVNNLAEMLATPPWVGRAALILMIAGWPVALILAWFLEPGTVSDVPHAPTALRRRLNFTIV